MPLRCCACASVVVVVHDLLTQAIAEDLIDNFAVAEHKMFLTGCSNGAMFAQYAASKLHHMFRAVIPNYALPLKARRFAPPPRPRRGWLLASHSTRACRSSCSSPLTIIPVCPHAKMCVCATTTRCCIFTVHHFTECRWVCALLVVPQRACM